MIGKVRGFYGARHDLVEIPPPLEGNAVEIEIAETATLIEAGIQLLHDSSDKAGNPGCLRARGPLEICRNAGRTWKLAERSVLCVRGERLQSLHVLGHALCPKVRIVMLGAPLSEWNVLQSSHSMLIPPTPIIEGHNVRAGSR